MNIGLGLPESLPGVQGQLILDWARKAEAGPFASLSVFDRLAYTNFEPLITLAAAAAVTQRIRLITSVLLAPLRNPAVLAKMVSSLDALSNGRLSLGLGIGGRVDDFQTAAVPFKQRAQIFEAQLSMLRQIWSGQPVNGAAGLIGPSVVSQTGPEILIGGYSPRAVRRVGRWGDGFISSLTTPEKALDLYHVAEESWREAGRPGKPRFVGGCCFALGPNAMERAGPYLTQYFGDETMARSIPTTPGAVRAALEARLDVGMDEVLLWPCIPDLDQIDRVAEIIHQFQ